MLSEETAGPKQQPRFPIKHHSTQVGVGSEWEVNGLNKVNPTFCKVRVFRLVP